MAKHPFTPEDRQEWLDWINSKPSEEEISKKLVRLRKLLKRRDVDEELKAQIANLIVKIKASSDNTYTDHSLLTQLVTRQEDANDVVLSDSDGKVKKADVHIDGKLTYAEYNLLRAIYTAAQTQKVKEGDMIYVSASQLYNLMRRGVGSGKVHKYQQEEIVKITERMRRTLIIHLNQEAKDWLDLPRIYEAELQILHFGLFKGVAHGHETNYYYQIYNVGLLFEISKTLGQLESISNNVLAIEQQRDGKWVNWSLSDQRIDLRTSLEFFIYRVLSTGGHQTRRKTYESIFSECNIGESWNQRVRAKKDIAVILDWWEHIEVIQKWSEYEDGKGIEITINLQNFKDSTVVFFVPNEMVKLDNWVLWKLEADKKVPYSARVGKDFKISTADPSALAPYSEARGKLDNTDGYNGLGFVLTEGSGLVFIDLDDCFDENGEMNNFASRLVNAFAGTYMEYSQSGNGLHIICKGRFPKNFRHNKDGHNIEIYVKDRFVAITGKPYKIPNEPVSRQPQLNRLIKFYKVDGEEKTEQKDTVKGMLPSVTVSELTSEDRELLDRLLKGEEFRNLYNGTTGSKYSSESESDIRLLQLIWVKSRNKEQTIRIFRSSKPGKRDKALRADYLERTLDTVIRNTQEWEERKGQSK